jgi:hypothetical protein
MNDTATLFVDGAAYGRRMGRWSRLVSEIFLDWLAALAAFRTRLSPMQQKARVPS